MPRKSAAALAIVPHPSRARRRLPVPAGLPEDQAAIWRATVGALPPSFFGDEQVPILRSYCLHTATAIALAHRLAGLDPEADVTTWGRISAQQVAHSKAALAHGRALRVVLNARVQPDTAGRAALREAERQAGPRPWDTTT